MTYQDRIQVCNENKKTAIREKKCIARIYLEKKSSIIHTHTHTAPAPIYTSLFILPARSHPITHIFSAALHTTFHETQPIRDSSLLSILSYILSFFMIRCIYRETPPRPRPNPSSSSLYTARIKSTVYSINRAEIFS